MAAEVAADRPAIQALIESIRELSEATQENETLRALALAFQLERLFTAIETVCARVVRNLDGDVPVGADWHAELLRTVTLDISDLRPALLDPHLRSDLFELLKFRHFARHGYEADVRPAKVFEQAERAMRIAPALDASLERFEAWLLSGAV